MTEFCWNLFAFLFKLIKFFFFFFTVCLIIFSYLTLMRVIMEREP